MFRSAGTRGLPATLAAALITSAVVAAVSLANIGGAPKGEASIEHANLVSTHTELAVPALGATLTCKDAVAFHSVPAGPATTAGEWPLGAPSFKECKSSAGQTVNVTTKTGWILKQEKAGNLEKAEIKLPKEAASIEILGVCTIKVEEQVVGPAGLVWKNGANSELSPSHLELTNATVVLKPPTGTCAPATSAEFTGFFKAFDMSEPVKAIEFS
jgi:hypothetical protein